MQPEDLATPIFVVLVLGIVFYAGYGWRMVMERRLHNMPWLKKSARKAAAAAAKSTSLRPVILPLVAPPIPPADPPAPPANTAVGSVAEETAPNLVEETTYQPAARRPLSLRRKLQSE